MRKKIAVILMLALIAVMIGGCVLIDKTSNDDDSTEPTTAPAKIEPTKTEPTKTEPVTSDDATTPKQTEAEPDTKAGGSP